MSSSDDPFAPPPAQGPAVPPGRQDPAPAGAGTLGTASLVLGLLALALGVTLVGGVLFGGPAVVLGLQGRARARARGGPSGTAVAGALLGLLGLLLALGTYLLVRDDIERYERCRRASVSLAQDRACEDALRGSLPGAA